jgi:tRNA A37 threonylcarbamoyladenosine modification protein TsaB
MDLLLDASQPDIRLALCEEGRLLWGKVEAAARAETVEALLRAGLEATGRDLSQIRCILTTRGPGSFTGLRVALAFAQGLCLPVAGRRTPPTLHSCTTFEALACLAEPDGSSGQEPTWAVLLPARKGWSYLGLGHWYGGRPVSTTSEMMEDIQLGQHLAGISQLVLPAQLATPTNSTTPALPYEPIAFAASLRLHRFGPEELLLDHVALLLPHCPPQDPILGIRPEYLQRPAAEAKRHGDPWASPA